LKALSHVRICDFTGQLAGAGATRFLAAFGAQVIRIEDPVNQGRWDILRNMGPFVDARRGPDLSGPFNNHNVEKLGITLNLRTDRLHDPVGGIVRSWQARPRKPRPRAPGQCRRALPHPAVRNGRSARLRRISR
jgi:hypothetical protein